MSTFRGDFTGFSYNGKHSSEFGIVRVSNGDRYTKHLSPSFKLQTVEVPGADGVYYFGKKFNQKVFDVSFGFDNVTEEQIREMGNWLNSRGIHELIFDEEPYKVWDVQISDQPNIKFVCFDEEIKKEEISDLYGATVMRAGDRIYKGEGTIKFICYTPCAHTPKNGGKYLDYYEDETKYPTKHQWGTASGLLGEGAAFDNVHIGTNQEIDVITVKEGIGYYTLYNGGQKECPFKLKIIPVSGASGQQTISLEIKQGTEISSLVVLSPTQIQNIKDPPIRGLEIDTKAQLIKIIEIDGEENLTGEITSQISGEFFTIPVGLSSLKISASSNIEDFNFDIQYDYLYY